MDRVIEKISVQCACPFRQRSRSTWTEVLKKFWSGVLELAGRATESRGPNFQKNLGPVCLRLGEEPPSPVDRVSVKISFRRTCACGESSRVDWTELQENLVLVCLRLGAEQQSRVDLVIKKIFVRCAYAFKESRRSAWTDLRMILRRPGFFTQKSTEFHIKFI